MSEGQRQLFLGQAMDLTSLVWLLGICMAFQQHMDDKSMVLTTMHNNQGVEITMANL